MAYISIENLQVASPCSVPWSGMTGCDTVRSCAQCQKNVYNLSLLTRAEASDLILEKEGRLCIRFYKRFDGTVLTADCPKGLRAIRTSYIKTRARAIAVAISILTTFSAVADSCRTTSTNQSSALTTKKPAGDSSLANDAKRRTPISITRSIQSLDVRQGDWLPEISIIGVKRDSLGHEVSDTVYSR